jgi:uncharacterized protein YoxC
MILRAMSSVEYTVNSVQYLMYSVQCLMSSVQCIMSTVQCITSSVQSIFSSVQRVMSSVQRLMYSVQCTTSSVQCITPSVQSIFSSVQHVMSSVQRLMYSVQCIRSSVQSLFSSVQCVMSSVQCLIPSVQCLMSTVQYMSLYNSRCPFVLKSRWCPFRLCCPQYCVLYTCCEDWCCNMAAWFHPPLCVVFILQIGPDAAYRIDQVWIDWPCSWCWWQRNVRHYHNKYSAKIKGAACFQDVTPRLLVNTTFRKNLVTSSSRVKQPKESKHCCRTAWQTNTKHRLSETSEASQITSTRSRTAEGSSYFVNKFDFRAFCVAFVVHKVRVGQNFLQALQFALPGSLNHCSC